MVGEVDLNPVVPNAALLLAAVALDLWWGDPQFRWHPIRLVGATIDGIERLLRALGRDRIGGGVLLGVAASTFWVAVASILVIGAAAVHPLVGMMAHVLVVFFMLALRNLIDHVWAVEVAARKGDVQAARHATSMFVARDTDAMDIEACRRAGIESLSENLTDGYISPVFWYLVAGVPGIVAFKVFSTLDSMVGNRSERYLYFGRFSARTDDVLNWIPARLTWLLIAATAIFIKGCSASAALAIGWAQHALVPGPNSGWSEAATAGALRVRLVGPIVLKGHLVTDIWLGAPGSPPAGATSRDIPRAIALVATTGLVWAIACAAVLHYVR